MDTIRRHPRTTVEAFGPYGWRRSSPAFTGPYRRRGNGRIRGFLLACAIGFALGWILASA